MKYFLKLLSPFLVKVKYNIHLRLIKHLPQILILFQKSYHIILIIIVFFFLNKKNSWD